MELCGVESSASKRLGVLSGVWGVESGAEADGVEAGEAELGVGLEVELLGGWLSDVGGKSAGGGAVRVAVEGVPFRPLAEVCLVGGSCGVAWEAEVM